MAKYDSRMEGSNLGSDIKSGKGGLKTKSPVSKKLSFLDGGSFPAGSRSVEMSSTDNFPATSFKYPETVDSIDEKNRSNAKRLKSQASNEWNVT